jgi:riboflavin synthase
MFTGIIEETGRIDMLRTESRGATMRIASASIPGSLKPGDSIAVNGVCLTVTAGDNASFQCELSPETMRRTSFEHAREGTLVNLERSLLLGARLGGHFVLGHVDAVGRLSYSQPSGAGAEVRFEFPKEIERYLVFKGSVAVDGISLTIASLEQECFSVAVIPHTLRNTNLHSLRSGDCVNLEVDILGKYFERFWSLGLAKDRSSRISLDYLKEQGF